MQISTSHAMVHAMPVAGPGGAERGTEFTFDSRRHGYGGLPEMGRFWVRVLAEDDAGREGASPVTEVLIPECEAITGVRALPLGGGAAVVEWRSAEPTNLPLSGWTTSWPPPPLSGMALCRTR